MECIIADRVIAFGRLLATSRGKWGMTPPNPHFMGLCCPIQADAITLSSQGVGIASQMVELLAMLWHTMRQKRINS
jgi:hypothetical protein